jgi:hypothetical protein
MFRLTGVAFAALWIVRLTVFTAATDVHATTPDTMRRWPARFQAGGIEAVGSGRLRWGGAASWRSHRK